MKILVTGSNGYLASRLCSYYKDKYDIIGLTHKELDVTNRSMVEEVVYQIKPDIILHCAAESDVEACDENPKRTWDINVNSADYIASASCKAHAKLIFCSSDQVYFKSHIRTPHLEEEKVTPPHEYGRQKLRAEELVMGNNPDAVCLRLSVMYALDFQGKNEHSNFIGNIINAVREVRPMTYAVHDFRSITDVWDVVCAMEKAAELPGGIYNFGSENDLSTYQTVKGILDFCHAGHLLTKNEVSFADEPRNLVMNTGRIKAHGIELPSTMDRLHKNIDIIKAAATS
jgi:dTDP-4-dehydrorhamnose reductase